MTRPTHVPLRIGLTGGIGSGKSTVAAMLASHGAVVIDFDAISRRLTGVDGPALPALRRAFGDRIVAPNGALDRAVMRRIAFGDAVARHQLEAVLHPMISDTAERQAAAHADAAVLVFDIPLLVESGVWRSRLHRVAVVECSAKTQIERVAQRAGWTAAAVESVIGAQASGDQRRAIADDVIANDGASLAQLAQVVAQHWQAWCALAAAGPKPL
jgi:dephospho-CoA kinase